LAMYLHGSLNCYVCYVLKIMITVTVLKVFNLSSSLLQVT